MHRKSVGGQDTPQSLFIHGDEAVYLRAAGQWARGEVAVDFLGDFIAAARREPRDEWLHDRSPAYRAAHALAMGSDPRRPAFVSYRSMVFPLWAVPFVWQAGCTGEVLTQVRESMVAWRVLGVLMVGLLAHAMGGRLGWIAGAASSVIVAADAQLDLAGANFMPDMPGAALLMTCLWGVLRLTRRPTSFLAVCLGLGMALAALVKADLLYVLPLSVAAAPWVVAPAARRRVVHAVLIALVAFAATLGAWGARNQHHTGMWFVTSKDAFNLYIGNNPEARARDYRYGVSAREWEQIEQAAQDQASALRQHGPEIALRIHLGQLAKARVLDRPDEVAAMTLHRLGIFVRSGGQNHFPAMGEVGLLLGTATMVIGLLAAALGSMVRWNGIRALLPAGLALLLSMTITCLVFFEARYMAHLFMLAVVVTTALCGRLAAGWTGIDPQAEASDAGPRAGNA